MQIITVLYYMQIIQELWILLNFILGVTFTVFFFLAYIFLFSSLQLFPCLSLSLSIYLSIPFSIFGTTILLCYGYLIVLLHHKE